LQKSNANKSRLDMGTLGGIELIMLAVVFLPPLVAFWNIIQNDFKKQNQKIIWLVVVIMFLPFGALAYYLFGTKEKVTS
jgi:hypothetical protein